jgi:23S rRNA pseudouridine2605 synthase
LRKRSGPDASKERPLKTLDRVLSKAGLGSRTEARKWIGAGRVEVNGKRIQTPDHWVDLERDRVTFDGKPVRQQAKTYLLLYKPKGYITTYQDPQGRPTVYDLIADVGQFLGTVGRLDQDTSGLLLLTNDTQFAERVTNPDQHVPKTYLVKASTRLSDEQLDQLRNGIVLSDGPTRPAIVNRVRDSAKYSFIEITIDEGRNRQVRRMLEALDSKVLKLVRTAIGPISIGDLQIGHYRELTSTEVNQLGSRRSHQLLP